MTIFRPFVFRTSPSAPRIGSLFFASLALLPLLACGPRGIEPTGASAVSATGSPDGPTVVATLDGREITISDVDQYMMNAFIEELRSQSEAELFEARNKGLQEMIQKQIIDEAAAEAGVEPPELFDQVVADVPPPNAEEVAAWYTQNQGQLRGAPLEQVSSRIEDLLLNEKRGEAWGAFMSARLEALDLDVVFEPPRAQLEATRLVRGNPEAPVTIMTFSDYQCPYCVRAEPMLAEILTRFPEQVRVIHRHFPLDSIHPFARPASEAAMCADEQGKFWEYHDAIFARRGKLDETSFAHIGGEVGLDADALGACISERRYADFVQQDFDAGRAAGVTGTPAFFVNGVAFKGARDAEEMSQIVQAELDRVVVN